VPLQTFMLLLVVGAAVLALWIIARFTGFGPRSLAATIVHVVIACVLLRLVQFPMAAVNGSGLPGTAYLDLFAVALPLLVYAFLAGGWVTRAAIGLLRP
jgi:hypothetical protein